MSGSLRVLLAVFRNRDLRRLQVAQVGSDVTGWAYAVALYVFAYDGGGAAAVGLVLLLVMVPAGVVAPFTAIIADRFPRERVLVLSLTARAAALGLAAVAAWADLPILVYGLAVAASMLGRVFEPARAALLPSLARTPEELAAANAVGSTIGNVGFFVGPALGGVLLAVTSPEVVIAATAATLLLSVLALSGIRSRPRAAEAGPGRVLPDLVAGGRAIVAHRRLRLLVGLYGASALVGGALSVLLVVSALELLELGEPGVGLLNAAVGAGGFL
jgi:MFS family permease